MAFFLDGTRAQAWKMVDAVHADAVAKGSLLLGTLASYAELENGRADPADGDLKVVIQRGVTGDPGMNIAAKMIPFDTANALVYILNSNFTIKVRPCWVLCMTEVGCRYDPNPQKTKAIFEISNLGLLVRYVMEKYGSLIHEFGFGKVEYSDRNYIGVSALENQRADPFLKDKNFEREREIRAVFIPREGVSLVHPLVTEPDYAIEELLKRVE